MRKRKGRLQSTRFRETRIQQDKGLVEETTVTTLNKEPLASFYSFYSTCFCFSFVFSLFYTSFNDLELVFRPFVFALIVIS